MGSAELKNKQLGSLENNMIENVVWTDSPGASMNGLKVSDNSVSSIWISYGGEGQLGPSPQIQLHSAEWNMDRILALSLDLKNYK